MTEATEIKDARAERVERWRVLLSGVDSTGVRGERLRRGGSVNLLTGVWLHAAARAEQGLELTELERGLLGPLQEVLGEEEVAAVGRVYRQRLAEGGPVELVPSSVASRSLHEGYDYAEYRQELAGLLPQIMALPNVAVVDRAKLAAGQGVDTPEFTAAMAEYGYGVTTFTGEDDHEVGTQETPLPFLARLEWKRFACHEPVGDQWATDDEIYWTAASNAQDYGMKSRSEKVGSVVRGGTYDIPGKDSDGTKAFFHTALNGCGSVVITMWEADQSNAEWYTALGKALDKIVATMEVPDLFIGLVPGMDLIGHLNSTLGLLSTIWEGLRNKDDLALTRAIAFGRADLKAIYDHPLKEADWRFDARSEGMGDFTLTVRYAGADPSRSRSDLPDPRLEALYTEDGTTWHRDIHPTGVPDKAPALAAFDGKLYCVIASGEAAELQYASSDGSTWSPFSSCRVTDRLPALAAFDGKLYCVTRDFVPRGSLRLLSFDGNTWTPSTAFTTSEHQTDTAASLAVYDGKLYCAVLKQREGTGSSHVSYASFDGSHWSAFTQISSGTVGGTPSLAAFDGKLYCVIDASETGLEYASFDGSTWSPFTPFLDRASKLSGPSLAAFDGKLYCAFTTPDHRVEYTSFDGRTWSPDRAFGLSAESHAAPALAVFNDKLHCMHT